MKPHPLNQKARKRSERSRLFRQIKAIIQCFNQTYAVQTRRESSLRVFFLKTSNLSSLAAKKSKKSILRKGLVARFSQDVQFELFGRQKVQKERLEKRFGGSIFSRRPIWAFWPPKSPKRASWEKVWWLDSWRVLEKILLPSGTKPISPYIYSFSSTRQESTHQTFSQDALFGLFGGQKAKIGRLEKIKQQNWILPLKNLLIETCRKNVINNLCWSPENEYIWVRVARSWPPPPHPHGMVPHHTPPRTPSY